jgi:uncharacterized protein
MAIRRRDLLLGVMAGALGAARAFPRTGPEEKPRLYAGCHSDSAGNYQMMLFEPSGVVRAEVPLRGRGHGIVFDPRSSRAVVLARRPGTFAIVVDVASGRVLQSFSSAADRHFYGHGAFSSDGRYLYTTENDYEAGRGTIGIRAAGEAFRLLGEFSSFGIGPHEVRLMPDGATLAVANGGIRTHPNSGRAKLNIDTMRPALVFIDASSGRLLNKAHLESHPHKLSIRHIDVTNTGIVAVAMQYEGSKRDRIPLIALWKNGQWMPLRAPADIEHRMRHYTGGVAFDASGEYLAVSCPRGDMVTFWKTGSGQLVNVCEMLDGSGVAAHPDAGNFIMTGRKTGYTRVDLNTGDSYRVQNPTTGTWDNHLGVTGVPA